MKKLIVVMDLGCLKGYRVTREEDTGREKVEMVTELESPEAHQRVRDKVTDQAGRFPAGNGNGSGGLSQGEAHNLASEHERRTVKLWADSLLHLVRKEGCDLWYLGAAKAINHRVVDSLAPDVRSRLKKNLAADLTRLSASEVLERFRTA